MPEGTIYAEAAFVIGAEFGLRWSVLAVMVMATDPEFEESAVAVKAVADWTSSADRQVRAALAKLEVDGLVRSLSVEVETDKGTPMRKLWMVTTMGHATVSALTDVFFRVVGRSRPQVLELCECGHPKTEHGDVGCRYWIDEQRMCACRKQA